MPSKLENWWDKPIEDPQVVGAEVSYNKMPVIYHKDEMTAIEAVDDYYNKMELDKVVNETEVRKPNDVYEAIEQAGKEQGLCRKMIDGLKRMIGKEPIPVPVEVVKTGTGAASTENALYLDVETATLTYGKAGGVGAIGSSGIKTFPPLSGSAYSGSPGMGGGGGGAGTTGIVYAGGYDIATDGSDKTAMMIYHATVKNTKGYTSMKCINNEGFEKSFENGIEYMKVGEFEDTICMINMVGDKVWVSRDNFKE